MKNLTPIYTRFFSVFNLLPVFIFSGASYASTHPATVSDLLITEIMANPTAVLDTRGEWFELFNPTAENIDLSGLVLSDDASSGQVITSAVIEAGSYFVMARNGDSNLNGGFTADYVYSSFTLSNTSDQIIFTDNTGELLRFDYGAGFVPAGASMELIDAVMLPENYATTTTTFGAGDFGTPGTAGSFIQPVTPSPVPIPAAFWLMGSGLLGLAGFSHRQKA